MTIVREHVQDCAKATAPAHVKANVKAVVKVIAQDAVLSNVNRDVDLGAQTVAQVRVHLGAVVNAAATASPLAKGTV